MTDITPLREFVVTVTDLLADKPTEQELLPDVKKALSTLIAEENWLPDAYATPCTEHYCQNLLHCDPLERFSVVSFVWGPGQETPIHDHRTWGVIGMYSGSERETPYNYDFTTGDLTPCKPTDLKPGMIGVVSPRLGDIHHVRNASADEPAISIHVYGGNVGMIKRRVYDPETGKPSDFISGYTRDDVPNLWGS